MSRTRLKHVSPNLTHSHEGRLSREQWELDTRPIDILTFGSQLVYGSVGTNGSTPPLEAAGLRVATIPTAILSNLPHHPSVHSHTMPPNWIAQTLDDLTKLGIADEVTTISTGYFADPEQVEVVGVWLRDLIARRPGPRVIVDPTLGDHDVGHYTQPAVANALGQHLLPHATGITPNLFELDLLQPPSDAWVHDSRPPDKRASAAGKTVEQARQLLQGRTNWVIVTGANAANTTHAAATIVTANDDTTLTSEYIPTGAKGTGDLFVGALIAALHRGATPTLATSEGMECVRRALTARSLSPTPSPLQAS